MKFFWGQEPKNHSGKSFPWRKQSQITQVDPVWGPISAYTSGYSPYN